MQQMNLFQKRAREDLAKEAPLAERFRPRRLKELVGQKHLVGPGKLVRRLLEAKRLQSLILWGPPGCGKTTLARLVAAGTESHLVSLSAVMAGTREIRAAVEEALTVWGRDRKRTWLFMDEIHRLNKAQQDVLLPHVEQGVVLLLGATTENPSFEVIRPLLSRSRVLVLEPLGEDDLGQLALRALAEDERGLGRWKAVLEQDALEFLAGACGGDARILLNALEVAVSTTAPSADGTRTVDLDAVKEALQRRAVHYDKSGEEHFNLISALHKSLRGSDPDAGLYWLARMLDAGEDPLYIARRLVRFASEDVGLADPAALPQAVSALESYRFLGSPEGDLALAQAVVYLSLAPKSNALYTAYGRALDTARKTGSLPVPVHLRNAPTELLKNLGYGREYRYPHDDPRGWVEETYLPEGLPESTFYHPVSRGWEGRLRDQLIRRRRVVQGGRRK